MLTLCFESDIQRVENAYKNLGVNDQVSGANFLFFDEKDVVGFMRIQIDGHTAFCEKTFFLPTVEDGDKEFFVRVMFAKFQTIAPIIIRFDGIHPELKEFGFEEINGGMEILSNQINLHNKCPDKKD